MSFFIGTADETELLLKEVMTFQAKELSADLPTTASRDPRHGNLGVVITDLLRHAAKESEGTFMSFKENFRAFPVKHLAKDRIGVWQRHDEECNFLHLASDRSWAKPKST